VAKPAITARKGWANPTGLYKDCNANTCRSKNSRLKENGKKPKQIIIAIMRKLLHQIYGILKSGQPYDPNKRGFAGAKNGS
jgi:hypothetical protein